MAYINKPKKKVIKTNTSNEHDNHKIYNSVAWRKLRLYKLQCDPLCEICKSKGKYVPAVHVHHKIKFSTGVNQEQVIQLAYDINNLQSLCLVCHELQHYKHKDLL